MKQLTHLDRLEAEAIYIIREVAAECEKPVMLYSIGKDSSVMLHLALKAFYPEKPPFPFLHIDTTWKFKEMVAFRDRRAKELGIEMLAYTNMEGVEQGINPFDHGSEYTDVMKTVALKQGLDKYGFTAAFGGGRRDEEKSRAKERIFSFRNDKHAWDPKNQRPEMWDLYNTKINKGESMRVFPISNWTEKDIWQYILRENIEIVPLYFAKERPFVERDGNIILVDDERLKLRENEEIKYQKIRFRTLGCYPLTGGCYSEADTLETIVKETLGAVSSERTTRVIDNEAAGSMERRKERGISKMENSNVSLLKFITCGSVDDGKSTLIGHMLYKAKLIFADQEQALELDSKVGSNDGELDYALLLDGLMAEREQGITIDVAYRYFTTENRSFIVADCPGHEQYTRNMAVGASFADLAVILVDASKGVLIQTKRHTRICSLMGVKNIVLAVNKIDLIGYNKERFDEIKREFMQLCSEFNFESIEVIPVSAKVGDNIIEKSSNTSWYKGLPLLPYLESLTIKEVKSDSEFVLPVQRVCRPNANFRGFQGQIQIGNIKVGDEINTLPEGEKAVVKQLLITDKYEEEAVSGQPVTLILDREIDISRGSVITKSKKVEVTDMFVANMLWMDDKELLEGRNYFLKLGTKIIPATIMKIKYKIDINTGKHISANSAFKNELVSCEISLASGIALSDYEKNSYLGRFILIDRLTNMTSGCGTILHSLRRSTNVTWQKTDITKEIRANQKEQSPKTLWFTGLSGSGKSTLANELEKRLVALGKHTMLLDGDNVRHGLNKNLGFTPKDRIENIRRVSEVAKLMNDAGLIVATSFISPFEQERLEARRIIGDDYIEIYVSTPLEICEERDVKGLYKKAREGEIPNFTGINSPYEKPENAEIEIDTSKIEIDKAVDMIIEYLELK